jgi:hypothetical protein
LYSRELHAEFIKGHHESLVTDQCSLPQFVLHAKDDGPTEDTLTETEHLAVGKTTPTAKAHADTEAKPPALSSASIDAEPFSDRLPRSKIPKKAPIADAKNAPRVLEGESPILPDSPPAPEVRVDETPEGKDSAASIVHPNVPPVLVKIRVDGKLTGNDLTARLGNKISKTPAPAGTVEIDSASQPSGDQETSANNQKTKLASTQEGSLERTSDLEGNEKNNGEALDGGLQSHWLVARIVWVSLIATVFKTVL